MREKTYKPSGVVGLLLEVTKANPARVFTCVEAGKVMGISAKHVHSAVYYAVRSGALFHGKSNGLVLLSGSPLPAEPPKPPKQRQKQPKDHLRPLAVGWATDPNDPRIQKVTPGWHPPAMVCVRLGQ